MGLQQGLSTTFFRSINGKLHEVENSLAANFVLRALKVIFNN